MDTLRRPVGFSMGWAEDAFCHGAWEKIPNSEQRCFVNRIWHCVEVGGQRKYQVMLMYPLASLQHMCIPAAYQSPLFRSCTILKKCVKVCQSVHGILMIFIANCSPHSFYWLLVGSIYSDLREEAIYGSNKALLHSGFPRLLFICGAESDTIDIFLLDLQ